MTYEELYGSFRWQLPAQVNLGVDVCERHPCSGVAIVVTDGREVTRRVTFGELSDDSNRLANALRAQGVGEGDRVGIALPQRPETAVAHVAVYKLGAIAVPLSTRFGPDAMAVRLGDAEPAVVSPTASSRACGRSTSTASCPRCSRPPPTASSRSRRGPTRPR